MTWKKIIDEKPPFKKFVNVFRDRHKKYVHAQMERLCDEEGEFSYKWVTQHGIAHDVSNNDAWQEFEYYSEMMNRKTYSGF